MKIYMKILVVCLCLHIFLEKGVVTTSMAVQNQA